MTMKLNPPETAPKTSEMVLLSVDELDPLPAVWNILEEIWTIGYCNNAGAFVICPVSHNSVTGWLPMPQIDNEGNVI